MEPETSLYLLAMRKLCRKLANLVVVKGGDHNNLPTYQTYKDGLKVFLEKAALNSPQ